MPSVFMFTDYCEAVDVAVVCRLVRQCVDMLMYIVVSSRWCPFLAPTDDVLAFG